MENTICYRLKSQPRKYEKHPPTICYDKPEAAQVNKAEYDDKRYHAIMGDLVETLIVPKKSAKTWTMEKGDLCRITVCEGSQVGDMNFWNLENTKERFYSGKTRQIHSTHLSVYDRLWSNLPYLNPMATVVFDTLKDYGVDE
uniref:DUF1989 domain-containing protein n=1 Tax=Megaselia scalaris TaxID=36166 RepID=T1GYM6_MEGSC